MSRFIFNKSGFFLDTMQPSNTTSLLVSDLEEMMKKCEEMMRKNEEIKRKCEEFDKISKEIEKRLRAFEEDKTISNLLKKVDEIIYAKEEIIEKEKLDKEMPYTYFDNVYGSYEKFKEKLKILKENFERLLSRFSGVENSLITKKLTQYSVGFFNRQLVSSPVPDPDNVKHDTSFNKQ